MNEIIFFIHIIIIIVFANGALKLGREALTAWVALQAILANLFVIKQMVLFGFNVTCSDVFAIGSIFGLNLLQEHFGQNTARRAAKICFYFMLFFALMSQVHLLYEPSLHDISHPSFVTILSPAPRLLLASLATFFLVQQIDLRFFAFLKNRFTKMPLMARNGISLTLSQFLDTVLFSFFGLFGEVANILDIIFVSFALKLLIVACNSFGSAFISNARIGSHDEL
jgi:queuosine precursor transporter